MLLGLFTFIITRILTTVRLMYIKEITTVVFIILTLQGLLTIFTYLYLIVY